MDEEDEQQPLDPGHRTAAILAVLLLMNITTMMIRPAQSPTQLERNEVVETGVALVVEPTATKAVATDKEGHY